MGQVKKRGRIWWVRYYRDGRRFEESARSEKRDDAVRLLKVREGDVARGLPVTPKIGRLRFDEAIADVLNDYRVNGKRSLRHVESRVTHHLMPFFAGRRMASITTADVRTFVAQRQAETILVRKERELVMPDGSIREMPEERRQVSNGEINRELTVLKRAFSLALQAGKLLAKPHIPMLRENNVRTGFFEADQFLDVLKHLPADVQPVVRFAYITGWRIASEVLPLEWRHVDFNGDEIRLDAGTTKNDEARAFPLTTELRVLLEERRRSSDKLSARGRIQPWVFHREGRPIKTFIKAWRNACRLAGCPGRLQHDFRRTAVRNLVRAGVPERVAMQMTGHKTRSVFERYNIVSATDLRSAAKLLDTAACLTAQTSMPHK
jgi:integrase